VVVVDTAVAAHGGSSRGGTTICNRLRMRRATAEQQCSSFKRRPPAELNAR
jgi:hypothetical protein